MRASPSAAVLTVVIRLSKDSGAGPRSRSGPGTGMGVETPPRLFNSLILSLTVSKYLIILFTTPCCCVSILSSLAS